MLAKNLLSTRTHLYPQKLALTSPKSGGRSVGKVRSRTKATELVGLLVVELNTSSSLLTFTGNLFGKNLVSFLNVMNISYFVHSIVVFLDSMNVAWPLLS
jgi:hypothetical protein